METTIYAKVIKGADFTEKTVKGFNDYSLDYYAYLHSDKTLSVSYAHAELSIEEQKDILTHIAGKFREIEFL